MSDGIENIAASHRGLFITFEGGDGAGKSTHIRFLSEALRVHGCEVVSLREPGGTRIGEKLREVLLDPRNDDLSDQAELLVFEAARAQIVAEVIKPALDRGAVVLCDRFTDSTVAYQAYGRGLSLDFVRRANEFACQGIVPDRTILLTAGGSSAASNALRAAAPTAWSAAGRSSSSAWPPASAMRPSVNLIAFAWWKARARMPIRRVRCLGGFPICSPGWQTSRSATMRTFP